MGARNAFSQSKRVERGTSREIYGCGIRIWRKRRESRFRVFYMHREVGSGVERMRLSIGNWCDGIYGNYIPVKREVEVRKRDF